MLSELIDQTPGEHVIVHSDTLIATSNASYVILKEYQVGPGGEYSVLYDVSVTGSGTISTRIEVNGTPVGGTTEVTIGSKDFDITVVATSTITVVGQINTAEDVEISNFRIQVAQPMYGGFGKTDYL